MVTLYRNHPILTCRFPSLGPSKLEILQEEFHSYVGVEMASKEELLALEGIGEGTVEAIREDKPTDFASLFLHEYFKHRKDISEDEMIWVRGTDEGKDLDGEEVWYRHELEWSIATDPAEVESQTHVRATLSKREVTQTIEEIREELKAINNSEEIGNINELLDRLDADR